MVGGGPGMTMPGIPAGGPGMAPGSICTVGRGSRQVMLAMTSPRSGERGKGASIRAHVLASRDVVDLERVPADVDVVHGGDRLVHRAAIPEEHKSEALGTASRGVLDKVGRVDGPERLEHGAEHGLVQLTRDVADVHLS